MANLITLSRIPVLLMVVGLLYAASPEARLVSIPLLLLLIGLDTLDGVVARLRHETSLMGSVLDIMIDRAVEYVMWIVYADLRLVPVAIPILCVLRGTIVDGLRSVHVEQGTAPFKIMRTRIGAWLVGSPFMRSSYGAAKLLAFAGLAVTRWLQGMADAGRADATTVRSLGTAFLALSWVAVGFCLVRGLPVVIEALGPALSHAGGAPTPRAE